MHWNFGKTSLSYCTRMLHHHQWGSNRYWELSPHFYVMASNIPPITSHTLSTREGLPNYFRHASTNGHTRGRHQIKGILKGYINRKHHNPHHWWLNLGGMSQKCNITDDTNHITATSYLITTNLGQPSLTMKTIRIREPSRAQYVSGLVHPDPLTMDTRPPPSTLNEKEVT